MPQPEQVYLDYNATTPCAPEVVEAMLPLLAVEFGNAGSPHVMGRAAAATVAAAREQVAALAGCGAGQLIFTSGATESNNLALLGVARSCEDRRKIVVSAVEHKSILAPAHHLVDQGFEVVLLPVDQNATVDVAAAAEIIDDRTLLVCLQGANNEVGTIQPLAEIAEIAKCHGALVHTDSAQVLGKIELDLSRLPVDLASFSAHKLYGPKGIGALYIRNAEVRSRLSPLQFGGRQEGGLRPGTANVPAIAGFAMACKVAGVALRAEAQRVTRLRDRFEQLLRSMIDGAVINASMAQRLPNTSSFYIPELQSDVLIANAHDICASDGAACDSGTPSPSHVLLAMGLDHDKADATVRVSLGRQTTDVDVTIAANALATAASRLVAARRF